MTEFLQTHWIEIAGTLFGLFYLYFEYKASILMWPSGLLMSGFYIYVFFISGFYSGAAINIYYMVMGIYGWLTWYKKSSGPAKLRQLQKPGHYVLVIMAVAVLWGILSWILEQTDSTVFVVDALITSLSLVAMWMLTQRYIQQWILLIVANVISVFAYAYTQLYFTSIMYIVYTTASAAAYFHWKKLAEQ
ncbi:nicotinamide riboside transporter PnuC [Oxalobacter aliiformigenes]|uniref:nicotinamide riboside transporter PnuC n=1 Tax=Oxalobacter aliiformigenes TaxID=2946593 RepID=UPI0022AEE309|nr:nicotinamide riboside transporter PnuC [Oxalobacter aliiformigenes]WAV88888.1 nicotinamide riboside transporter PnuC [Oxalobacter aliiformigenes]